MAWREIYNWKKLPGFQQPESELHVQGVTLPISGQIFVLIAVLQKHLQQEHLFWLFRFKHIFDAWKKITFYHHNSRQKSC